MSGILLDVFQNKLMLKILSDIKKPRCVSLFLTAELRGYVSVGIEHHLDNYNPLDCHFAMQTVVELPEFQRKSSKLLSTDENKSIIHYLAAHPAAGDIMQGTGGIRKLRWVSSRQGQKWGSASYILFS